MLEVYERRKRIFVVGLGTCSIWPDTETVSYFQIEDQPPLSGVYFKTGHIVSTFYSDGSNEAFRVTLDTAMPECSNGFGYVNISFNNYAAYVSGLSAAFHAGKVVNLTYGVDSSGYCQIIEYQVL